MDSNGNDDSSAEAPNDVRTDRVDGEARHPLPERDHGTVLRIQRIVLRDLVATEQQGIVRERRRLKPPVVLERERPGIALAPAVVEHAQSALASAAHELPVLELVGGGGTRFDAIAR